MLHVIAAAMLSTATIDLPAGTMICASATAAQEYLEARADNDEHRLHWLSGSVCHKVTMDFNNQRVLGTADGITMIEWTFGKDRRTRFVIAA